MEKKLVLFLTTLLTFGFSQDRTEYTVDGNVFLEDSLVSGTGSFMNIVFSASASGTSSLIYSTDCELADPDDNPIEIKGFGEGVVNAQ